MTHFTKIHRSYFKYGEVVNSFTFHIDKAFDFINHLEFDKIDQLGFSKRIHTEFWPGHTIVTYPFYNDLKKNVDNTLLEESLFSVDIKSVNLYVHIPFCSGICSYCAYSKSAKISNLRKNTYLDSLNKEFSLWLEKTGKNNLNVDSIYIGGGTPTELSIEQLKYLMNIIHKKTNQNDNIEVTLEGSPETLLGSQGKEKLLIAKDNGINRISIGVQSFDDDISFITGRRHGKKESIETIYAIQDIGFNQFNIDLMYGLPNQTLESWLNSISEAINLGIPSITLYPLKIKDKSILEKEIKTEHYSFEYETKNILLFSYIAKLILEENGYIQNTVYWFIKSEKNIFNQQKVKYSMKSLLGIGCSTYSYISNSQFFNIYNELKYNDTVKQNKLPIELGRKLSLKEIKIRFIIFGLKKGFSDSEYNSNFCSNVFHDFPLLNKFLEIGLIKRNEDFIDLTSLGSLFADEIGVSLHKTYNSNIEPQS